jgi:hypothetical protein
VVRKGTLPKPPGRSHCGECCQWPGGPGQSLLTLRLRLGSRRHWQCLSGRMARDSGAVDDTPRVTLSKRASERATPEKSWNERASGSESERKHRDRAAHRKASGSLRIRRWQSGTCQGIFQGQDVDSGQHLVTVRDQGSEAGSWIRQGPVPLSSALVGCHITGPLGLARRTSV